MFDGKSLTSVRFLFLLLLICSLSFSATLYVNATLTTTCDPVSGETNYGTIQGAVDASVNGDTIMVCDNGTAGYTENVVIMDSINIHGNQSGVAVKASDATNPVFTVLFDYTNVSNFTFSDSNGAGKTANPMGIYASGRNLWIYNVTAKNNHYGFYLTSMSSNNILTNNTAVNNDGAGFFIDGNNHTASFNVAINNSGLDAYGFEFGGTNYIIISNYASDNYYGFIFSGGANNTGISNNASNNSVNGFSVGGRFINLSNNYATYNGAGFGIMGSEAFIFNNTGSNNINGLRVDHTSGGYILQNTMNNNSGYGFGVTASNSDNLTNNIAYNNGQYGFTCASDAADNTFAYNLAYNNSYSGFSVDHCDSTNFTGNTAHDNTGDGFSITDSIFYADTFFLDSNYAFNNSQSGFTLSTQSSTFNTIINNTATNNSAGAQYIITSSMPGTINAFANNRAFQTPSGNADITSTNVNLSTLSNGAYNNFTTDYGTIFFDNAANVSIKMINLTDSGAVTSGCSSFSGICTLLTPNTNAVNITNNSDTAIISLGMFYNSSAATDAGATSSQIEVGKYSNGWTEVGQTTIDTDAVSVIFNGITTFSTFGIVSFIPTAIPAVTTTATTTSSSSPLKKLQAGLYNETTIGGVTSGFITCPGNILEIATNPVIEGMEANLILYDPYNGIKQMKYTENDGEAKFNLTDEAEGRYQLSYSKSGYIKPEDEFFDFVHCKERSTISDNSIAVNKENITKVFGSNETSKNITEIKSAAFNAISDATSAIKTAADSGKDVSAAQKKLDEANAAFNSGNYENASKLAQEAKQLALNTPPAAVVKPSEVKKEAKTDSKSKEQPTSHPQLATPLLALAAVFGIAIVAVVAYFLLRGKGSSKGYNSKSASK